MQVLFQPVRITFAVIVGVLAHKALARDEIGQHMLSDHPKPVLPRIW
jgi:hypothetical protein